MKQRILLSLLACIISLDVCADNLFYSMNVRDGLSDTYVSSITEDTYGYMWMTTLNGLNRFDGYSFRHYSRKGLGYTYDTFSNVAEDGGGNLWVISNNSVCLYDRSKDCLISSFDEVLIPLGICPDNLKSVYVGKDKSLWCVGDSIWHYDFSKQYLDVLPVPGQSLVWVKADGINTFFLYSDGSLHDAEGQIADFDSCLAENIRSYIDSEGRLWVFCTVSNMLECYDPHTKSWKCLGGVPEFRGDFVNAVTDDGKGQLWFGLNSNGIVVTDMDMNNPKCIQAGDGEFSLSSNHINCIYTDKKGMIWFGTSKKGVSCTPLNHIDMDVYTLNATEDISTIIEDEYGRLWVGLDGQGLVNIDADTGTQRMFSTADSRLPSNLILDSFLDGDGNLYFSTYGNGPFIWKNGIVSRPLCSDSEFYDNVKFCREILKDNSGNLWLRTFSKGICCLKTDGTWESWHIGNSSLKTNHLTSMAYSPQQDRLYIGTGVGLYEMSERSSLMPLDISDYVTELHCDNRGHIWIGSNDGLFVLDTWRKAYFKVTADDGLSDVRIKAITSDNNGDIWVTTSHGFNQIIAIDDPKSESLSFRCYPFVEADGIGDAEFGKQAIYCSGDGDIYMGASNKLIRLTPERPTDIRKTWVTITSLSISGDAPVYNLTSGNTVFADYSDNITLEISAMDYKNRHRLKYEYRMNANSEWVSVDGNKVHFSNMNPGRYQLQLRAVGPNVIDSEITYLSLHVRPPFWKSNTAFIIYSVLLMLFIAMIYIQLREKSRRVLAMEKHDLDEAKLQFFTNICHDLRTPLTLILTPLGRVLREYEGQPVTRDLEVVEKNAQILMNEMNQLLDFRKLDKMKSQYNPGYGDINEFVCHTCDMFNILFSDNSSSIEVSVSKEEVYVEFDKGKMQRILYNLLSNAFKYNSEGGIIKVSVARENDELLRISVSDNGPGVSDSDKLKIFDRFYQSQDSSKTGNGIGLHIVKEYVELHDGRVYVKDNFPGGSVFVVEIPLRMTSSNVDFISSDSFVRKGKASVLIVEDNTEFRSYLSGCLSEIYDVVEAQDGIAALSIMDRFQFDIVITDVMMPNLNGIDLCSKIKNDIRYSHIPVIMLTAVSSKEGAVKGLKEGADEYIVKPFDYDILMMKIERLLNMSIQNHSKCNAKEDIDVSAMTNSRLDEQLLARIIRIVEENISNSEYSVEELSASAGMSRSALYKKLMFITGKSPVEFVRMLRLKKGREMLDSGETTIAQIAWSVGISPKLFAKYFKQEFGCLPSEYLRRP